MPKKYTARLSYPPAFNYLHTSPLTEVQRVELVVLRFRWAAVESHYRPDNCFSNDDEGQEESSVDYEEYPNHDTDAATCLRDFRAFAMRHQLPTDPAAVDAADPLSAISKTAREAKTAYRKDWRNGFQAGVDRVWCLWTVLLPNTPTPPWKIVANRDQAEAAINAMLDEVLRLRESQMQPGPGGWSEPDSPSRWATIFSCCPRTLIRRFKNGTIPHKKISTKRYAVAVDHIPERHRAKYLPRSF